MLKDTVTSVNNLYEVGSSRMQGWRTYMEDTHTHILSLLDDPGTSYFAVYDGHGSDEVSKYASEHLHWYITRRPEYEENDIAEAMRRGFLDLDAAVKDSVIESFAGSTAVVVIIKKDILYCANVGDSRAIAGINGSYKVLSLDHKPSKEIERRRILAAGGFVSYNRVNGHLATSRALGDFKYKKNKQLGPETQIVTAYPDVITKQIDSDWEFIVLASDGIWDVFNSEEVHKFVQERMNIGTKPSKIYEELMDACLSNRSKDNMTVIIVHLLHGQSENKYIKNEYKYYTGMQLSPKINTILNEKENNSSLQTQNSRAFTKPFQQVVSSSLKEIKNYTSECENSSVQKRLVEVRGTLNNPSEIENNQGFISTTGKESSSKSTCADVLNESSSGITFETPVKEENSFKIPSLMDLIVSAPPKLSSRKKQKRNLSSVPSLMDLEISAPLSCCFCRKGKESPDLPLLLDLTVTLPPKCNSWSREKKDLSGISSSLDLEISILPKCSCSRGKYSDGIF